MPLHLQGTSDTTVTVALPAANTTGLSFGVAVRTAPGTVAHAGAIVHVMVGPVDPKTGRRRASAGLVAFAEDGLQSPWDEATASRRPEGTRQVWPIFSFNLGGSFRSCAVMHRVFRAVPLVMSC